MKTEAETPSQGMYHKQRKKNNKEEFFPRTFRANTALLTPDYQVLAPKLCENTFLFETLFVVLCYDSVRELEEPVNHWYTL